MLDQKLISSINALNNNKDAFIIAGKKIMNKDEAKDFCEKMNSFNTAVFEYYNSLLDSALALQANINARKTKKVDPYIAGGLAQGAAGLGAGIYAAGTAAARNREIEYQRIATQIEVNQTSATLSSYESRLLYVYKEIIKKIYAYDELSELYQKFLQVQKTKEEKKAQEEKRMNNKSLIASIITGIAIAISIFLGCPTLLAMLIGIVVFGITIIVGAFID